MSPAWFSPLYALLFRLLAHLRIFEASFIFLYSSDSIVIIGCYLKKTRLFTILLIFWIFLLYSLHLAVSYNIFTSLPENIIIIYPYTFSLNILEKKMEEIKKLTTLENLHPYLWKYVNFKQFVNSFSLG